MASYGRANSKWKHGLRSGWTEYRYGTPDAKPVTLAGRGKPSPVLKAEKRRQAVDEVVAIMRQAQQTPFEFEGATRAAIRSALCAAGYNWPRSDLQADQIVSEALRILGATRPTWEQGQRQYVEPRENCKWCGCSLDAENLASGFCSIEHARFAYRLWDYETAKSNDLAYAAVERSMRRLNQKTRACPQCGGKFRPVREDSAQEYCSKACVAESRKQERPDLICEQCGTNFPSEWKGDDRRFCGTACAMTHRAARKFEMQCTCCGETYTARSKRGTFCSMACANLVIKLRNGNPPKRINALVFDYVFTKPINEAFTARRSAFRCEPILTAEIFDSWFKRAA